MALTPKVHEAWDGDLMEMVYERGWTDGLPVFPSTDNKVTAMIDYLGHDPGEVISVVPPGEASRRSRISGDLRRKPPTRF